jgi:YYY domain-containing protein
LETNHTQTTESKNRWGWVVPILLALILLFGATVRLTGMNWDEDQHLHPDERFLTMVESSLALPGTKNVGGRLPTGCARWGGYFDTRCSPLSPYNHDFGFFVYGTFPIFLTRFVGEMMSMTGYSEIHLVGRALSALFDLSTVLLIFFIGRRMYGARAGLLGALFLAGAVLDIQQSHFFTVDTFTNVPILIAFWFALDIADGKPARAFLYAGAAFGLALAGRINIALFAVVLIAAAALRAYRRARGEGRVTGDEMPETLTAPPVTGHPSLVAAAARAVIGLVFAALIALIVFRIAQPYAANGPGFVSPSLPRLGMSRGAVGFMFDVALSWAGGANPKFIENMITIGDMVSGKVDFPPAHQWADRAAYLFPLENIVLWGLGAPLGIAACAGFLLALYELVRHRKWEHLLIVVWVGITFGYSGQQFGKTMRYFLQIYPFLALLAGYFLVALWDKVTDDRRRMTNVRLSSFVLCLVVGLITLIVAGYTIFWATAFTTIYTRPVSRVTASRWIIANVPPGSRIGTEHWDDPLPLRVDGKDPYGGMFRGLSSGDGMMGWYGEDTPEKRVQAIGWLDEADYIVLSSNRLYGSIPRLPMRYPMTTKYYEWLFDGTLGFDQVAEFTSRPQLFGIEIKDDDAEEAFTVYDHPKVSVFKKTPRYSHAQTAQLFNSIDLDEVYRFTPLHVSQSKTALLLAPEDWDAQRRGGTWSEIFNPGDWVNQMPVVGWLVMITSLGWIAFPIAFVVFRALADRGYIFAKAFGILLPAWIAWWLASAHALPFSRASIALAIALVALCSAVIVWRSGRALFSFLREHLRVIVVEEFFFLLFFAAFLAIRFGNPDLWHPWFGGEKPMDFAHLNAIIKSTWFPPYDPWFAGGYLNYYYFGHLITATLIRFSGIVPEVAYNLALPMYFALTAMGAFSVVWNVAARKVAQNDDAPREGWRWERALAAFLGALFVAVIGNLGQLILIGQTFVKIGGGDPQGSVMSIVVSGIAGFIRVVFEGRPFEVATGWWYWNASRVIPDTINEFPFFTFLYGDLHAHLMALPFTLVVIGLAVNFAMRERDDTARLPFLARIPVSPGEVIEVIVAGLVLGGLRAINYADNLTYLVVIVCALAIGEYARRRAVDWSGIVSFAWKSAAIYLLSTLLWQPFVSNFATAYLSVGLWEGKRTALTEYLVVHGIFLFPIVTFLVAQSFGRTPGAPLRYIRAMMRRSNRLERFLARQRALTAPPTAYEDFFLFVILLAIGIEAVLVLMQLFVFAFVFPLLILAGLLVLRPNLAPERRLIALLIAAGLALTLAVEVIVYKGDIGRMNTVFKFYLQVWVFFAIAAAVGLDAMLQTKDERRKTRGVPSFGVRRSSFVLSIWWLIFAALLIIGFLYPATAARAKASDRFVAGSPSGLDGMEYMRTAVYQDGNNALPLEYDRQAIEWLRANAPGAPVILEGNAPLYRWGSRVSIYTGLPTVIGWDWHEKQQRSIIDGAIIDRRIETVRNIYNTRDVNVALEAMKRFRVEYVYIGDLERAYYDAPGLAKFDAMARMGIAQIVYQNERVKIFQIKE